MKLFEIRNTAPRWLLCEDAEGKNIHLEHLEDLVFNEGYLGAQRALNYLESIREMLADGAGPASARMTVKWDGSPAIICGTDPEDGRFFVATKHGAFKDDDPELCKTPADIKKFYGDRPLEFQEKLQHCLKYLSKLGIGGVLQGDLMFTPGDIEQKVIDGEEVYTFTPQLITYAVPVNSELGKKIASSKLGIIFSVAYEGSSLPTMKASFGAEVSGLNRSRDVWFDDATYKDLTGVASLTPQENREITALLRAAASTLTKINPNRFDAILSNKEFAKEIKPFINDNVRKGEQVGDPTTFVKNFIDFYRRKQEKQIEELMKNQQFTDEQEQLVLQYMATRRGEGIRTSSNTVKVTKNRRTGEIDWTPVEIKGLDAALKAGGIKKAVITRLEKIVSNEEFMEDNVNSLLAVLAVYKRLIEIKLLILRKLQTIESIGTFLKTDTGYRVTAPEGFVAIGHEGDAVKLVDRIEFSRENFLAIKAWKKT